MHTCDDIVMVVSLYQQTNLESKFTSDRAKVQVALWESRPMVIKLLCGWPPSQSVLSSLTPLMICIHLTAQRLVKRTGKVTKRKGRREDSWRPLIAKARAPNCRSTLIRSHHHPIMQLYLHHYWSGATADVNTHQTVELGTAMRDYLIASYPGGFHHTISSKVKTMQSMKWKATVNSKPVYDLDAFFGRLLIVGQKRDISIADLFKATVNSKPVYDLDAFFGRLLIVGQKRDISIADLFNYELAPVPPSLINDYGCLRKSDKSILVRKLGSTIASPSDPDILLIYGNRQLYHVVWPVPGTVENIAASIKARLGTLSYKVYVIFDRYDGVSAKDHERLRRPGDGTRPYHLATNTPLPARKYVMGI